MPHQRGTSRQDTIRTRVDGSSSLSTRDAPGVIYLTTCAGRRRFLFFLRRVRLDEEKKYTHPFLARLRVRRLFPVS